MDGGEKGETMLSRREMAGLLDEARRNETILLRLEEVEDFLMAHRGLAEVLAGLGPLLTQVYGLQAAGLALIHPEGRLGSTIQELGLEPEDGGWIPARRGELRLLLGELERPVLTDRPGHELVESLFQGQRRLASAAVIPLWARGELLGTLNLGSENPDRYQPGLETDFLQRLGRKVASGLDAGLVHEQGRLLERREAVVEMAGAACHNLAQPLTTAALLAEKLRRGLNKGSTEEGLAIRLIGELERVGELVQRISEVSSG